MTEKNFQPEWICPPGATISDVLKKRKLSVERFAELIEYPIERARKLITGREAITIEVAKLLESKVGGSTTFWMSREEQYRNDVGHLQSKGHRAAASIWLTELPVKGMMKLGWLACDTNQDSKLAAVSNFLTYQTLVSGVKGIASSFRSFRFEPRPPSNHSRARFWHGFGMEKSKVGRSM